MKDAPERSSEAPLRPALAWAWEAGPPDAGAGPVEARLAGLAACGWEAVLLQAQPAGADTLGPVRRTAAERGLRVVEAAAARSVRLESPLTERQIGDLAHALVERTDLDAIVGAGPEQDAAALLVAARRLRRRLERLAWARFQ